MSYLIVALAAYFAGAKWPDAWMKIPGATWIVDKIKAWSTNVPGL